MTSRINIPCILALSAVGMCLMGILAGIVGCASVKASTAFHNGEALEAHELRCEDFPDYRLRVGKTHDQLTVEYLHGNTLAFAAYFEGGKVRAVRSIPEDGPPPVTELTLDSNTSGYSFVRFERGTNDIKSIVDLNGDGLPEYMRVHDRQTETGKRYDFRWTMEDHKGGMVTPPRSTNEVLTTR